uniref:Uncharacterized protein n=1 Tax=Corethron hystrix TaxID=216773 RepID=A0A7S1B743_9STRA
MKSWINGLLKVVSKSMSILDTIKSVLRNNSFNHFRKIFYDAIVRSVQYISSKLSAVTTILNKLNFLNHVLDYEIKIPYPTGFSLDWSCGWIVCFPSGISIDWGHFSFTVRDIARQVQKIMEWITSIPLVGALWDTVEGFIESAIETIFAAVGLDPPSFGINLSFIDDIIQDVMNSVKTFSNALHHFENPFDGPLEMLSGAFPKIAAKLPKFSLNPAEALANALDMEIIKESDGAGNEEINGVRIGDDIYTFPDCFEDTEDFLVEVIADIELGVKELTNGDIKCNNFEKVELDPKLYIEKLLDTTLDALYVCPIEFQVCTDIEFANLETFEIIMEKTVAKINTLGDKLQCLLNFGSSPDSDNIHSSQSSSNSFFESWGVNFPLPFLSKYAERLMNYVLNFEFTGDWYYKQGLSQILHNDRVANNESFKSRQGYFLYSQFGTRDNPVTAIIQSAPTWNFIVGQDEGQWKCALRFGSFMTTQIRLNLKNNQIWYGARHGVKDFNHDNIEGYSQIFGCGDCKKVKKKKRKNCNTKINKCKKERDELTVLQTKESDRAWEIVNLICHLEFVESTHEAVQRALEFTKNLKTEIEYFHDKDKRWLRDETASFEFKDRDDDDDDDNCREVFEREDGFIKALFEDYVKNGETMRGRVKFRLERTDKNTGKRVYDDNEIRNMYPLDYESAPCKKTPTFTKSEKRIYDIKSAFGGRTLDDNVCKCKFIWYTEKLRQEMLGFFLHARVKFGHENVITDYSKIKNYGPTISKKINKKNSSVDSFDGRRIMKLRPELRRNEIVARAIFQHSDLSRLEASSENGKNNKGYQDGINLGQKTAFDARIELRNILNSEDNNISFLHYGDVGDQSNHKYQWRNLLYDWYQIEGLNCATDTLSNDHPGTIFEELKRFGEYAYTMKHHMSAYNNKFGSALRLAYRQDSLFRGFKTAADDVGMNFALFSPTEFDQSLPWFENFSNCGADYDIIKDLMQQGTKSIYRRLPPDRKKTTYD